MFRISFCTTCMNRLHHLKQTLTRNILDNEDYENLEFVLIDYHSSDGLMEYVQSNLLPYIAKGRLVYYRTTDPQHYNMSHSRNMAFKLATGDIVCNIDADNYTGKSFAHYVNSVFQENTQIFLSTHRNRWVKNDALGRICVKREHFMAVGGYDERMKHYGFDDYDFANRLSLLGVKQRTIEPLRFLKAIEHSNAERMENVPEKNVLNRLLVNYLTPATSELVLMFADNAYRKATMVNNFVFNATHKENSVPRDTRYKYSIKEKKWEEGHWKSRGMSFLLQPRDGSEILLRKCRGNACWTTNETGTYYQLDNKQLHEVSLFFYNQISNRNIMEENLKSKRIKVNNGIFGTGNTVKLTLN